MTDEPEAMPGSDNSIKDLGTLWGARPPSRRSHLNPARTQALTLLWAMARPIQGRPDLDLPQMGELHDHLANLWASEEGWETRELVRALGAAKATTSVQVRPEQENKHERTA